MEKLGGEQKVNCCNYKKISDVYISHISFSSINFLHDDNINNMGGKRYGTVKIRF